MASVSTQLLILERVKQIIIALDLDGIPDEQVKIVKLTKRLERQTFGGLPAVGIGHADDGELFRPDTQLTIDVGYPVRIQFFDNDRGDGTGSALTDGQPDQLKLHDRRLLWREKVIAALPGQRLLTTPCVYDVAPERGTILVRNEWEERGMWMSRLMFRAWARLAKVTIA